MKINKIIATGIAALMFYGCANKYAVKNDNLDLTRSSYQTEQPKTNYEVIKDTEALINDFDEKVDQFKETAAEYENILKESDETDKLFYDYIDCMNSFDYNLQKLKGGK